MASQGVYQLSIVCVPNLPQACHRHCHVGPPILGRETLQVLSKDPVMILSPYGLLKAIAYTTFLWPSRVSSSSPVLVSHTLQVLSYDPVMNLPHAVVTILQPCGYALTHRSPDLLKAQFVRGRMCARRILKR